jgi:hypothetical protein
MNMQQLYKIGDRVRIIDYIEGIVLSVEKKSNGYVYLVQTDYDTFKYSQRRLMSVTEKNDSGRKDEYRKG